jgi:hypothetical protein
MPETRSIRRYKEDLAIDKRLYFSYKTANLAHRGAHSGCDPVCGAGCGACARSRKPLPGGSGHHALRYYGRGGRCCPCTGFASRRVTPAVRTAQEAWPGAESGGQSPDESRSGAPEGERAPQAEALRKRRFLWRASAPNADKRRALRSHVCAADIGWMRLSALRSPRSCEGRTGRANCEEGDVIAPFATRVHA